MPGPRRRKAREPTSRVSERGVGQSAGGDWNYAQTFTPLASGQLVSAQFAIIKNTGSIGDYILRLTTVNGSGVPTDTVLTAAVVPNGAVADGDSLVTFTFANPFPVVTTTIYALVLARQGPGVPGVRGFEADTCAGAAFRKTSAAGSFSPINFPSDIFFATFVSS